MREVVIPLGFVLLGLLLIGAEVFIPSAGVLGVLATVAIAAGVVTAFYYGGLAIGTIFLVVTLVIVAIVIQQLFRWWPHTSIGRSILIPDQPVTSEPRQILDDLVGRVGRSSGVLMPSGYVMIDEQRYDAMAEVAIDDDEWIAVSGVDGRTLKVRKISESEALTAIRESTRAEDPLALPADEILDDPFDEVP